MPKEQTVLIGYITPQSLYDFLAMSKGAYSQRNARKEAQGTQGEGQDLSVSSS